MNSGSRDTRAPRCGLDATLHPNAFQDRGIKQSLRIWEQGHILAGVPVFWVAPEGHDQVTNSVVAEDDEGVDRPGRVISAEPTLRVTVWDEVDVAVDPDDVGAPPAMSDDGWAIVTSQTCDIQATGPGERHTHVQVSPVVRLDGQISAERLKAARAGKVRELVHLADFDEDGDWFADLRISLPVSKGVLLSRTPRAAFATTDMANKFSERVAAKIRRPALHDAVDDPLRKSLREAIRQAVGASETWTTEVEQFRIQVSEGDRLRPKALLVLVICFTALDPVGRRHLQDWKASVSKHFKRESGGCALRIRFDTVDRLCVRDYRDSAFIDVPELGGGAFW